MTAAALETLTCYACTFDFERPLMPGSKPSTCPECREAGVPPLPRRPTREAPVPRVATLVTRYRLGIELARHGLRCGRQSEVVAILDGIVDGDITESMLVEIIDQAASERTVREIRDAGIDLHGFNPLRHKRLADL